MINGGIINTVAAAAEDCTTNNSSFPTSNLAYYKLDGDAIDSAGTYNGTWGGTEAYGVGRFGPAAVFNGGSNYINFFALISTTSDHDFSFSQWVNFDTLPTSGSGSFITIWGSNTTTAPATRLLLREVSGSYRYEVLRGFNGSYYYNATGSVEMPVSSLSTSVWYNIVFTYTSSTKTVHIYLNGVELGTGYVLSTQASGTIATGLSMGRYSTTYSIYGLDGLIDQVRIFNTAITQAQVTELHEDEIECCTTDEVNYPVTNTAYYQLNGGTGTTVTDETGAYNGTSTSVTYGAGKFDDAAVFNGISSKIETGINLTLQSACSLSVWVYFTGSNFFPIFGGNNIITGTGTTINRHFTGLNAGASRFDYINKAGAFWRSPTISLFNSNAWNHIVITDDFTNNTTSSKLYVNGTQDTNFVRIITSYGGAVNTNLYIGQSITNANGQQYLTGTLDQVRIFPTVITAGQVAELYQEKQCGATPITNASFHYDPTTLSDGAVTAWSDSGSINRNLDLVSASGTITKNTSGGIESVDIPFVQTNSYLRVGGSSYTTYSDYPTNTSFTVSMFINVSTSYDNNNKYVHLSNFNTASGVELGQFSNFIWRYGLNPQEYDITPIIQGVDFWLYSDVTPAMDFRPYGNWRMLTVTFEYNPSSTSYLKWYYEDVLIHTESNTGTWGASATSFSLGVGSSLASARYGGIKYGDVLGFYGEVKTQSEIAEMFAYLKGKYGL